MNFKDTLAEDIDTVFFNLEEFGDMAVINGGLMTVLIDDETLQKHNLQKGEGLFTGELLFIVRKSEFGEEPIIDNRIVFNNKKYTVLNFTENDHTYSITLGDRRS